MMRRGRIVVSAVYTGARSNGSWASDVTTEAFDARDVFATKADLFATTAELKEEIGAVRVELKEEIAALRVELKGEIAALRVEVKGEIAALRTEVQAEIGALRAEIHAEIGALRAEMHQMEARLIRWMAGALIGGMVAAATISRLVA